MYQIVYCKQAQKDAKKASMAGLKLKIVKLLNIIKNDPFQTPLPYEKLLGDLSGAFSRRINIQHRLVYQVYEKKKIIKVIRMWTYYQ